MKSYKPASPSRSIAGSRNVSAQQPARLADLKLGVTMLVIVMASLISVEYWPAHGLLLAFTFAALSIAGVTLGYLTRRLALFLPMLLAFGLSVPLGQFQNEAAWTWTIGLWLRCLVSFLAGLWLIHVLPFAELLTTLQRWRVPKTFVAMLAFMYRYTFILWDELERLRQARDARSFGNASLRTRWSTNSQMIGLLLLRAMERAERTHHAMLARGWDGSPRFLGDVPNRQSND